ncbi:MAG: OmpA family protein [Myxococcota bacterium]
MTRSLAILTLLFVSFGCKVKASASASIDADGAAEADADVETDADAGTGVDPFERTSEIKVRREGDELVQEGGEINFETDEATLVGSKTRATLQAYAAVLQEYPEIDLRIEGHTDSRASAKHNRKLSDARAKAVRQWLIKEAGIEQERLTAVGHGEDRPKVAEPAECENKHASKAPPWCEDEIWSHNRRSEFHVTAGLDALEDGEVIETRGNDRAGSSGLGFYQGPYIYLSPGLFRVAVANRDETDARRVSYRWGLGAGYLWRRKRFAAALGLGFAHVPVAIDRASERCAMLTCRSAHEFVLDAELRLGGGSDRVIGYGLLGPGLVIGRSRRSDGTMDVAFTTGGFSFDLGAGLWGLVWRGLFLGGEVALNVGAYTDDVSAFHDRARVTGLDLRFLLGWHFGWKP